MDDLLKKVRILLGDSISPFAYSDDEMKEIITVAVYTYSKYNPIKRNSVIRNGETLPEDYQTWVEGLEGYEITGGKINIWHRNPVYYTYLAVRTADEIPKADYQLIGDFCFYYLISSQIKAQTDISSIKLGQGLQLQFSSISELENLAKSRLDNFKSGLARLSGGWA